jgi:hypothetical protein
VCEYEIEQGEKDVSRSFVDLEQPTDADLVSNPGAFLKAHRVADRPRYRHALRFGRKLLRLEPHTGPDVCGLLVFCHYELWHVNDNDLPALAQRLVSDETLMDLIRRNRGWFPKVAGDDKGKMILVRLKKA